MTDKSEAAFTMRKLRTGEEIFRRRECRGRKPSRSARANPVSSAMRRTRRNRLAGSGAGLACIFTPCVFPMIPITMSYFLNQQSGEKRSGVTQAVVFCLGIIVLFSGLGLLVTAVLGPVGVKQLGSNPWVNGFIALLFMAFGLSLLGAFEITIPSSILTRLNQSSGAGGFAGTLLMGLTFALSSFACVGPFVGTLLAASVSGGRMRARQSGWWCSPAGWRCRFSCWRCFLPI